MVSENREEIDVSECPPRVMGMGISAGTKCFGEYPLVLGGIVDMLTLLISYKRGIPPYPSRY